MPCVGVVGFRKFAAAVAVLALAGLPFASATPAFAAGPATAATAPPADAGDPQNTKCKPHKGKGLNPHCPAPVVPEAPVAALLPLSAALILGATYVVSRRRTFAITA